MNTCAIKIRVSERDILREYLAASSVDFGKLQGDTDKAELLVSQKMEALSIAQRDFAPTKAERDHVLRQKKAEVEAAYDAYKRSGEANRRSDWWGDEEGRPCFNKFLDLTDQARSMGLEMDRLPGNVRITSAKLELSTAQQMLDSKKNALQEAQKRLEDKKRCLPDGFADLQRALLTDLVKIMSSGDLASDAGDGIGTLPLPQQAGIIRGELPFDCGCHGGYVLFKWCPIPGTEIDILLDDKIRHPHCHLRGEFDSSWIPEAIPAKHQHHRLHSLVPYDRSPLSRTEQAKPISEIPARAGVVRSWLMVGAPGTSKSTYAAAAVIDWLTWRAMYQKQTYRKSIFNTEYIGGPEFNVRDLNFWRIKVPRWVRAQEAWEQRDFGDTSTTEPTDSIESIEIATRDTGLEPIVVIEEMDKFQPTKNRLRNLYCLVDYVYESNGTIITTSNLHLTELKELVGEPIYRRLSGENDDPQGYLVWDLFRLAKKMKSKP